MGDLCRYEFYLPEGMNPDFIPFRVLDGDGGMVERSEVTRERAKELLQAAYDGPPLKSPSLSQVKPGGVRFLNSEGGELLRYSVEDLYADGGRLTLNEDR